jgi:hypothetical protein
MLSFQLCNPLLKFFIAHVFHEFSYPTETACSGLPSM